MEHQDVTGNQKSGTKRDHADKHRIKLGENVTHQGAKQHRLLPRLSRSSTGINRLSTERPHSG